MTLTGIRPDPDLRESTQRFTHPYQGRESDQVTRQNGQGGKNATGKSSPAPSVSIVLPCLNEERTVATCVRKAQQALTTHAITGEVIVADNGSTDTSAKKARQAGANVVRCQERGYGAALRCGIEHARGEFIIIADADNSYDLANVRPFINNLQRGADVVAGDRFAGGIQPGAMPWKNRYLGNPGLTRLFNFLFGQQIRDTQCGLRGFTRQAYDAMELKSSGMEFASEVLVKAAMLKMRIDQVPTTLRPDGRQRPPHLSPWRDGLRHLRLLLTLAGAHHLRKAQMKLGELAQRRPK